MIIGLVMSASLAYAGEAQVVYYDITGNSARELRAQMNMNGPLGKTGKRFDGHTDWHVSWSYRYAPAADGCKFTTMEVSVTGTMILPRWAAGDGASSALARKWQKYVAALRLHEEGHYSHGTNAAEEIRILGESFRASEGCSAIARLFNDRAASIIERYKVADAEYDARTKHGRTQGAWFP